MKIRLAFIILLLATPAFGYDGVNQDGNPYASRNNPYNNDNNPWASKNNPFNNDNNPWNNNARNIIRDTDGNATGYAVERKSGGKNIFDLKGNRRGYTSGD
ncbi:MAG: hypothetical protein ABJA60_02660 [Nitrosospira sp.]